MRASSVALVLFLAVCGTKPVMARGYDCPGFSGGKASPVDVDFFYAERAVAIVRAGLKGDALALNKLVLPTATFEIYRGDSSTSARQHGVPGALEMIRDLKPIGYQVSSVYPGPISVLVSKCEWTATVLFRTEDRRKGVQMKFRFVDGLLENASGNQVTLLEGNVR